MSTESIELEARILRKWEHEFGITSEPFDFSADRREVYRLVEIAIEEARRTVVTPADPVKELAGKRYMENAKGALVPVEAIDPVDLLMDELVRKVIAYAEALSSQIGRFKGYTFEDINSFMALVDQEYGVKVGGPKGNKTLTSFDGCLKVTLQVADQIDFGPEIQAAKSLIDECLRDWSSDSRVELRALVDRVFSVDKEGAINRAELFMLLRVQIEDERWQRAMEAIRSSIRVLGSKEYLRFYHRPSPTAPWESITIDIASARAPAAAA